MRKHICLQKNEKQLTNDAVQAHDGAVKIYFKLTTFLCSDSYQSCCLQLNPVCVSNQGTDVYLSPPKGCDLVLLCGQDIFLNWLSPLARVHFCQAGTQVYCFKRSVCKLYLPPTTIHKKVNIKLTRKQATMSFYCNAFLRTLVKL